MRKLLFLTHRFPYPANKGDKIRALNILEHLARTHQVFLGCVDDDAEGGAHLDWAKQRGYDVFVGEAQPWQRLPRTAVSLIKGEPLSVGYFAHGGLMRWARDVAERERPDLIYVFSSAMAQYLPKARSAGCRLIMDFVDADSVKWREYAKTRRAPLSWIYAREARALLAYDRALAMRADAALFVSEAELEIFRGIAPETAAKLRAVPNGVDTVYFTPSDGAPATDAQNIVFVGVMDYWPNVDAAQWFAREILPRVRDRHGAARFQIVGSKPNAAVLELAALPGVEVTGAVPDVRPYLENARVVVTPLRIARGIQNKVLEGMAMARPLVTTPGALEGIAARDGEHLIVANDAPAFAAAVARCLSDPELAQMGHRARDFVLANFSWERQLQSLDAILAS